MASGVRSKMRALIIDDSDIAADALRDALEASGFDVAVSTTAIGARGLVMRFRPDIVVVDLEMPILSGAAFTELLREHPDIGRTVVLLYSAQDSTVLQAAAHMCGADGWSMKEDPQRVAAKAVALVLRGRSARSSEKK